MPTGCATDIRRSRTNVNEQEAEEIAAFLNTLVEITIKEFPIKNEVKTQ